MFIERLLSSLLLTKPRSSGSSLVSGTKDSFIFWSSLGPWNENSFCSSMTTPPNVRDCLSYEVSDGATALGLERPSKMPRSSSTSSFGGVIVFRTGGATATVSVLCLLTTVGGWTTVLEIEVLRFPRRISSSSCSSASSKVVLFDGRQTSGVGVDLALEGAVASL